MSLKIISEEENKQLMRFYFSQTVPFTYGVLTDDTHNNMRARQVFAPAFMLKNKQDLISNKDGSVTWNLREIGLGFHSFLEIITGEKNKRKVCIPLCLVNPNSRKFLQFLLQTTRTLEDNRYNSQPAQFYILSKDGRGFLAKVKLQNLATHYVMLQLMPPDFVSRYWSQYCLFCREVE
jgi:hypothetical protein